MNFTSLRYFQAVAEELNITHAAEKLFISQQALSKNIISLEEELGVPLFIRTPSLRLTYAGQELLQHASEILQREREMRILAEDIGSSKKGRLRLGISHTCGRAILPLLLPRFQKSHPFVDLSILEGNTMELSFALNQGDLDLIIGFSPIEPAEAVEVPLVVERQFLVANEGLLRSHFGSETECVIKNSQNEPDISLFKDLPFITLKKGNRLRTIFDQYCQKMHFHPNIILEMENIETAFALAQSGMGLTFYPELFRLCIPHPVKKGEKVHFFPIGDESTFGKLVIARNDQAYQTKAARDFVAQCQSDFSMPQFLHIEE